MNLGIVMRGEVLDDKRADGRAGRQLATWNTRRLPTAADRGVDEPALRGVRRLVARLLPAFRGCPLEPERRGGALRAHLRSAPVDPDHGRAVTALPRLALPGFAARHRRHHRAVIATRQEGSSRNTA